MKAKVFGDRRTLPLNDGSVKIAEVTIEVRGKRRISINDLILKNGELQLKSSKSKVSANQRNTGKGLGLYWKRVALIVGVLIIILGGLFVAYKLWTEDKEDAKPTPESIEVSSNPDSETGPYSSSEDSLDFEMVRAYLDNNEKWSRDSLENYSFSKGLFDALNEYQLEDLSNYQKIVRKSEKLRQIEARADEMKGSLPRGKFTDDNVITVDNYIKKLERILADKSAAKNETPQQEPSAPKVKDKKVEKTHSDTKPQQTGTPTSQQEAKDNKGGGDATTSSNQNSASPNKSQKKYVVGGPGKSHQKKK